MPFSMLPFNMLPFNMMHFDMVPFNMLPFSIGPFLRCLLAHIQDFFQQKFILLTSNLRLNSPVNIFWGKYHDIFMKQKHYINLVYDRILHIFFYIEPMGSIWVSIV